ncbi:SDR family NAD(P)-dependent oxidoreductase [Agromyces aurantiacus]|uniref:SDR family NAD(P)-dependent oxidoreductase n=1 Tax=Agromyces aurantiacus TaxID=165814 RepID=A0ABV9R5Q8_9MICO|nr:SDR family NAD(P)-dependent oxidoreductase [Agromyces aurantiacus]MBM7503579.1 NAD(P)-dependent dehydrogenase (short-subunit alcohol dehydrogenase family) [Agromyces aurantiacus]
MTHSDITSPTVLLTGPTSGIGAGMLGHLVRHPSRPTLVLIGRDRERLDAAARRARDAGLVAHPLRADLADLTDVSRALDDVGDLVRSGRVGRLDAAILNAGAQFTDRRRRGAQGWELAFTVNVIAQHLLLRGIRPLLADHGHAVLLGSSTHRGRRASFNLVPDPVWQPPAALATPMPEPTGGERFRDEREHGGTAYATSKLALVTLSHPWARRLADDGHRLNTYDPGLVAGTGLGRDMPGYMYWVWRWMMPAMSVLPGATTPGRTSRHAVELALGDAHPGLHGGYVEIGRVTQAAPSTRLETRQAELWSWLEQATAPYLPAWLRDGAAA